MCYDEKVLEIVVMVAQHYNVLNDTDLYTKKWLKELNFMLYILYHNKTEKK